MLEGRAWATTTFFPPRLIVLCRENAVDLRYATEHVILRESAEKFLTERYDYRMVQKIAASETG